MSPLLLIETQSELTMHKPVDHNQLRTLPRSSPQEIRSCCTHQNHQTVQLQFPCQESSTTAAIQCLISRIEAAPAITDFVTRSTIPTSSSQATAAEVGARSRSCAMDRWSKMGSGRPSSIAFQLAVRARPKIQRVEPEAPSRLSFSQRKIPCFPTFFVFRRLINGVSGVFEPAIRQSQN